MTDRCYTLQYERILMLVVALIFAFFPQKSDASSSFLGQLFEFFKERKELNEHMRSRDTGIGALELVPLEEIVDDCHNCDHRVALLLSDNRHKLPFDKILNFDILPQMMIATMHGNIDFPNFEHEQCTDDIYFDLDQFILASSGPKKQNRTFFERAPEKFAICIFNTPDEAKPGQFANWFIWGNGRVIGKGECQYFRAVSTCGISLNDRTNTLEVSIDPILAVDFYNVVHSAPRIISDFLDRQKEHLVQLDFEVNFDLNDTVEMK